VDTLSFADRLVLVTGAGRGIGRGYALLLASRAAAVVVADLGARVDGPVWMVTIRPLTSWLRSASQADGPRRHERTCPQRMELPRSSTPRSAGSTRW
jgi:NAD(P)-dependent dehydrogenase (short-subunit alcohol dehydrogenase family)